MAVAHQKLAFAVVLLALGGTLWSGYLAYKSRTSPRLLTLSSVMVAALAVQAAIGIGLGITGGRPLEPLHFVYGPVTLLALPAARALARGRPERSEGFMLAAGWLLTLALSLRAVGTGGGVG